MNAALAAIATKLETDAGVSTSANANEAGYWKRIAAALESLAGASTVANANIAGYQLRAVLAAETIASPQIGNSGEGYIRQLALAFEEENSTTYSGSWLERLRQGVLAWAGAAPVPGYDVIVLAGQSNMVGRYGPVDAVLDATDPLIQQYGFDAEAVVLAQDPLDHVDETADTVGLGTSLAKAYIAGGYLDDGREVLLVPCADGNTSFGSGYWDEGGVGDLAAIARVNAAMAEGSGTNQLVMIAWHQGESDNVTESVYAGYLEALIERWRTEMTVASASTPFVVGDLRTGHDNTGTKAALSALPSRIGYTGFASSGGLIVGADGTHFDAASQRTFGGRYFDAFEDALANLPTPTITSGASVSVNENTELAHALTASRTVTWSIIGGADELEFDLLGSTLAWVLDGIKDYEVPADANADNAYIVQVRATTPDGYTADQTITVTVTDIVEGAASAVLLENGDNLLLESGDLLLLEV